MKNPPVRRLIALLAVLLVGLAFGYSALFGSIRQALERAEGETAFLNILRTSDSAVQADLRRTAAEKLAGSASWSGEDSYRTVQVTLAAVSSCSSAGDLSEKTHVRAENSLLSDEQSRELARWIETNSVVPVCISEGKMDQAAAYYAWVQDAIPGVVTLYDKLPAQMAAGFANRALSRVEAGLLETAAKDWRSAHSYFAGTAADSFYTLVEKLSVEHRLAQQSLLRSDLPEADAGHTAGIYLAQSYNAAGMSQAALQSSTPLLSEMPGDSRVWQQYGQALMGLNRLEEAQKALSEAVRLAPGDMQALNRLGVLYLETGQYTQAEELFRQALATHDGAGAYWVWEHLGDTFAREGKTTQAVQAYRTSFASAPADKGEQVQKKLTAIEK